MVVTEFDERARLGSMKVQLRTFADSGGLLTGRGAGAEARYSIERELATAGLTPGDPIALDFEGVKAISVPFADECIGQLLSGRLAGYYEDHPVVALNADNDVAETLSATLRQRNLVLLGVSESDVELLGGDQLLTSTVRAARELGGPFSATDLARQLGVSPQAMNNRLKALLRSGALSRTRVMPARGGREFEYEIPMGPCGRSSNKDGKTKRDSQRRTPRARARRRQPA